MIRTSSSGKSPLPLEPARHHPGVMPVPAPTTETVRTPLWKDLRRPDLADTIRRICTLCGWSQSTAGAGQALAVVSALKQEGKSSIARALAVSLSQDHAEPVLLLECDLIKPTLAADFGLVARPGVSEVLTLESELDVALRSTGVPNLWLLPAGQSLENPSRLLRSAALPALMERLRERFAFIVVDLPAVLETSDAAVVARLTDGAVFVVKTGTTDQRAVHQALQLLSGVNLYGVVLNRWRSKVPGLLRRLLQA